ncbi:hypothetical protein [Paenisporosarcina sp. HGH0030]|uniref:hypothetical protein n=1 Tax=Paenisporosarcina sp. HGH0030 TaxID=1078085 RepID=UPI0003A3081A|nr:hypothetical protein [Paenisporosarcina sp. HGH0030]
MPKRMTASMSKRHPSGANMSMRFGCPASISAGVKQSGICREFGSGSFKAYVEEHVLTVPKSGELPDIPE